jgi:hypothetical protein
VVDSGPFQQWGLDFVGEIHPASSGQHRLILPATDYFTKWIEFIPIRNSSHKVIIGFLKYIMARFGCLNIKVTDNAESFKAEPLIQFYEQFGITLIHSTPYYPQGNGLVDSSTIKFERFCNKVETNFCRHRVVFVTKMIFFSSEYIRRSSSHTWIFIGLATRK